MTVLNTIYRFLSLLLIPSVAFSLNLEKFGTHAPNFFVHSLDVELHGDLGLVTGYGGLMIYDISDGEIGYINRFLAGDGRGTPFYNCRADGDVAYVSARDDGMFTVDISDPQNPAQLSFINMDEISFEDFALNGEVMAVAAHQSGILFINIADPRDLQLIDTFEEMENCWSVLYDIDGNLLAADGDGGLVVLGLEDDEVEVISRTATSGTAIDLQMQDNLCAVAVGANGVDLFDVNDPEEPVHLSNFDTPTYAGHIGLDGNLVAIADWNEVLVYDISDPENTFLAGRKHTEGRAMGVDIRDNQVYLADWSRFTGYDYGEIEGPDIELSTRRINPEGEGLIDTSIYIYNLGHETLIVREVRCDAEEFQIDHAQFELEPADSIEIEFSFHTSDATTSMDFRSNDTDEGRASVSLEGTAGLGVGDRAPDFDMPLLAGGRYRLSDQRGRIQLLIFWTSW